jgi:hypothetical protein
MTGTIDKQFDKQLRLVPAEQNIGRKKINPQITMP